MVMNNLEINLLLCQLFELINISFCYLQGKKNVIKSLVLKKTRLNATHFPPEFEEHMLILKQD